MNNPLCSRGWAAIAAGLVAGITGSKLLPPLLASDSGLCGARMRQGLCERWKPVQRATTRRAPGSSCG